MRTFVYLWVGTGVGMGIVIDGALYRGSSGAAGEIGYMPVGEGDPHDRAVRRRGMLEETLGAAAISRSAPRARPAGDAGPGVRRRPARRRAARSRWSTRRPGGSPWRSPPSRRCSIPSSSSSAAASAATATCCSARSSASWSPLSPFRPRIAVGELGDEAVLHGAVATALGAAQEQLFSRVPNRDRREIVV